jgi:cupin superfamily acireductone dioxygenase involved in methionine salvage
MALVLVRGTKDVLDQPDAVEQLLAQHGLDYQCWGDERLPPSLRRPSLEPAQKVEVLELYAGEIARQGERHGYRFADVHWVNADHPRIDGVLADFDLEHTHDYDERRFVVNGHATYTLRGTNQEAIDVAVGPGDFLCVPGGRSHWLTLMGDCCLMVVRLLKDERHRDAPFWTYYGGTGSGPTEIPRERIARAFGELVARPGRR